MKSIYFFLLTLVFSFTSLTCEAGTITRVSPQKVVHVLEQICDYSDDPDLRIIILEDNSAWFNYLCGEEVPAEGDVIYSRNGWKFWNRTERKRHSLQHVGQLDPTPVYFETNLTTFPLELDDSIFPIYVPFDMIDHYLVSNEGIYRYTSSFDEPGTTQAFYLLKNVDEDDTYDIVDLKKKQVRSIELELLDFHHTQLLALDLESQSVQIDGDDTPWHTFYSHAEGMSEWDPSDKLRFHSPEMPGCEEMEIDDEFVQFYLPHTLPGQLLRLEHGLTLDTTILKSWKFSCGSLINLTKGEAVFIWKWEQPKL